MNETKMLSQEYNHKHKRVYCPNCRTSKHTVYDDNHAETYCTKCGTILEDTRITSIVLILETEHQKEKRIRDLWRK